MTAETDTLVFALNGVLQVIEDPDPTTLLIDYLRAPETGLTGTKLACGEGGCGACTVTLSRWDPVGGGLVHSAVNACLRPICLLDGQAVTTTEGIGDVRRGLHPVQYTLAANNGSQCGYCTPGFVMNMFAGLSAERPLSAREIEDRFDGHICRCTGFRPILQAMRTFASDAAEHQDFHANHAPMIAPGVDARVAEPPARVVFPAALKRRVEAQLTLSFAGRGYRWLRPRRLSDIQQALREVGGDRSRVKLVGGNTDIGIYKADINDPKVFIDTSGVSELQGLGRDEDGLHIGAATTLEALIGFIGEKAADTPAWQGLTDLRRHLEIIANLQVRAVGTVGGNLMMTWLRADTAAPFPSDLLLTLTGLEATCRFASGDTPAGLLEYPIGEVPRPADLPPDAVLMDVHLPWSRDGEIIRSYKVRMRAEDSHPIVNATFRVAFDPGGEVRSARLLLGGLTGLPIRARMAEAALQGRAWTEDTLQAALTALSDDVAREIRDVAGAEFDPPGYRADLCRTLFYKFYVHVAERRGVPVTPEVASAGQLNARPLARGVEITEVYPREAPVGMPVLKLDAFLQASGEAIYTNDLAPPARGLHAAYVLSGIAKGRFRWRGDSPAAVLAALSAQIAGVVDLVTVEDVPVLSGPDAAARPNNNIGMSNADPVFAQDGCIISWGQPIALVLAKDAWTAQAASRLIEAEHLIYDPDTPVLDIETALAEPDGRGVFEDDPANGDVHIASITRAGSDTAWLDAPDAPLPGGRLLRGVQRTGAQAQFYMEVQNCLVIPGEGNTLEIWSSTQQPAVIQQTVSRILGRPASHIQVSTRRLGGGFGGKQFRPIMLSAAAAVAACKVRRPVKLSLTRNQDMRTIGKRHPYRDSYAVSYQPDGKLQGLRLDMVSNGGCTYDASFPVMDVSQQQADSCYFIPTFRTTGAVARTNLASNTAMRSFGTVQAILGLEDAIERVAHDAGLVPEDVRRANLYETATATEWQSTHFGQALNHCNAAVLFDELRRHCRFDARRAEVDAFNAANRWRKRGISLMPFKYGVGYQPRAMEQGAAYVSVYQSDGSVLVQTGGIEMGQGLDTKMAQIAAQELGVPLNVIRVGDTWTGMAPNATATAASSGSDLFGSAVKLACRTLRERLEAFCAASGRPSWRTNPDLWPAVIADAYDARVDLQAEATYRESRIDDVGGDHPYGRVFLYFTFSAACSEVEIDVLTGETTILRTDILIDNGKSLNPLLDIGQIEGGFIQGTGLMLSEQMMYTADGALFSDGTWDYKPPGAKSIPIEFNVRLHEAPRHHSVTGEALDDASVNSSRGIGEPPLVLASTVFFAVKQAVKAARRDQGDDSWPELEAPATVGRIQHAIGLKDVTMTL